MLSNRVSAIVPVYNRLSPLKQAIESIRAQSLPVRELIVVNDGSSDPEVGKWLETQADLIVLTHPINKGVSAARNTGIAAATSDWLAFLDSDDEWLPDKLCLQFQSLAERPEPLYVSHTAEHWVRNGKPVPISVQLGERQGFIYQSCLPLCCISPSSVVLHRDVFKAVGLFDETLPACEDYDMWLRVCSRYPVDFISVPLLIKNGGHSDQLSRQYWGMDRFRIQALTGMLESGLLNVADEEQTKRMLREKIRIYCIGARKRGKRKEVDQYDALLARFTE